MKPPLRTNGLILLWLPSLVALALVPDWVWQILNIVWAEIVPRT